VKKLEIEPPLRAYEPSEPFIAPSATGGRNLVTKNGPEGPFLV
jgi:hypothetical protein